LFKKIYRNQLFRETLFYGLATAINRGLILLALPFLGKYLSIEEYGVWSLSQILITLGAPLLSMNGSAAILREGADNHLLGYSVYKRFFNLQCVTAVIVGLGVLFIRRDWIFYTILLIVIEAFLSLLISWYRAQDKHFMYFLAVSTKLVSLFGAILITTHLGDESSLINILRYQSILAALLLFPLLALSVADKVQSAHVPDFKNILIFCLALLPHGFSQWILSGSDRLIIKSILGNSLLGYYSLAYSLAMVIMLINSGLGMTIPVDMIKQYTTWVQTNRRTISITLYSFVFLATSISIMLGAIFLKPYFGFLKDVNELVLSLLPWISGGMYFIGVYIFYINYLFYNRKSALVSTITSLAAVFSILCTFALVKMIGVEGAAVSTFISYFIYMAASFWAAVKFADLPWKSCRRDVVIILLTVVINHIALNLISYGLHDH
jgi:O-antigen/teichoic acid export membrane protein